MFLVSACVSATTTTGQIGEEKGMALKKKERKRAMTPEKREENKERPLSSFFTNTGINEADAEVSLCGFAPTARDKTGGKWEGSSLKRERDKLVPTEKDPGKISSRGKSKIMWSF